MRNFIKVMLWGKEIGRLAWHETRKLAYFNYNPEFLRGTLDVAPLVASIHSPISTRAIFGETERIYQKLPPFIADSLPDAWGNQLFEQWRKQSGLSVQSVTPLEKLAFIGKRGMGALEFVPEMERSETPNDVSIKALADLAEKIQTEREHIHIETDEQLTLHSLIAVGTSAGGRQPKGIIAIDKKTGSIRSDQVEASEDCDFCILKFGDRQRSSAELEQTYFEMARRAGISMMDSRLMMVEGTNHFLTKRFDRDQTGKLHTQTLAAICPGADSYEQLLSVCRRLRLPETDCQEVFRRMVFNVLANNTDDHSKNFTFIMNRKGDWRLAPAYDLTFIFDSGGFLPDREHCLMIGGKLQNISCEDALSFAAEGGIRSPKNIIRKVAAAVASFRELAQKNGVREEWIGRVESCLNGHLANWGFAPQTQSLAFQAGGHSVTNARLEPAYKGNYHLMASIDGRPMRYVLRAGKPEHDAITAKGLAQLTPSDIEDLVEKFLLPKIDANE